MYKINALYEGSDFFNDNCSIEHIIPEDDSCTLNIGNLIILETKLNEEADNKEYKDKVKVYKKSKLTWVDKFIKENDEWNELMIEERAKKMAKLLYNSIEFKI